MRTKLAILCNATALKFINFELVDIANSELNTPTFTRESARNIERHEPNNPPSCGQQ